MELRHLRYFAAVAEHLNYSEASRRLHVAQPAISQTILDLEEELGVPLFARTRRSVELTAAGSVFLRETREILRRATEAQRLARQAAQGEVGQLSIGFFGSATAPILPLVVQAYRQAFPAVELQLLELNPDQQLIAFEQNRIDIAFSRSLPQEVREDFHQEVVYQDRLAVALPVNHLLAKKRIVALSKLAGESFVLFHRQGAPGLYDEVLATCRRSGFSPKVVSEPNFMATVITLVESGTGISLVPGSVRSLNRPYVVIRQIAPSSSAIPLCLVWPKGNGNPAVAAFLEVVKSLKPEIAELLGKTEP
jgi:DNA-binding transcriptional LysR family regulator